MAASIYVVRHGQTALNKSQVLQGRSDHPLNGRGIAQAENTSRWLREHGIAFDRVYSSPLRRAIQTARIIAGDESDVQIDNNLIEMDYGPYEGSDLSNPAPEIITFFSDFVHNPAPEGMEPLSSVVERAAAFLERLKSDAPDGNVLVSTHAIAMKGLLECLTPDSNGSYWSKYIGNCAVYRVSLLNGHFSALCEVEIELDKS